MGVQGLWQLLTPTGRTVTLESLEGKVLAVDVSVWLHQSLKGMRDAQGNPVHNAHLHVLFHRVCKLLFYRIRPVFVFDGGVPQLKKDTLARRRQKRVEASVRSDTATEKLLSNLLKSHALNAALGKEAQGGVASIKSRANVQQDMFALNPIPETDRDEVYVDEWETRMAQRHMIYEEFEDLEAVDVEGEEFKAMPEEIQHEILSELKDRQKKHSWANIEALPEDSGDFSQYQMSKLMKSNNLTQKIEDVRKKLNTRSTGNVSEEYVRNKLTGEIETRRVVSDDTTHYILIKGLKNLVERRKSSDDKVKNVQLQSSSESKPSKMIETQEHSNESVAETSVNNVKKENDDITNDIEKDIGLSADLDSDDIISRCKAIIRKRREKEKQSNPSAMYDSNNQAPPYQSNQKETSPQQLQAKMQDVYNINTTTFVRAERNVIQTDYCYL